jgi:hypothetical protein
VPWSNAFLVMVKSAKAAERVIESLARFVEGRLKLVVTGPTNGCMNKAFLTCAIDGLSFTTGKTPVSDRNRRMPTGTCGGVALVAG